MTAERLAGDAAGIARAADLMRGGGVVAFPTDTVYGIGCRARDDAALARVFAAKRRPPDKAIAWLVSSLTDAERAGFAVDDRARELARAFWPGGLTLVLASASGDGSTQGFRVPDHPTALALIAAAGAIAASSANRSGEPEAWDADDVAIALADADELDGILDGGRVPGGTASSVLDLSSGQARLVREGALSRAALEAVIGPID
jgi:L-threonylcarbamoyladenylate synthase